MEDQIIELEHKPAVKHNCEYFPDGHLGIIIIGASGCGKSSILVQIIPKIANLSQIIICSLIRVNPVYEAIKAWCERPRAPGTSPIYFATTDNPVEAQKIIENAIKSKPEGTEGLIVLDDFSQQKSGRNDPYNQCSSMISSMLRNYGYHSCFITQSATNVPTLLRCNTNMRYIFVMNDQHAIWSIRGDCVGMRVLRCKEDFDELYEKVRSEEHAYLLLVTKGGTHNKLYISLPSESPTGTAPPKEVVIVSNQATPEQIVEDDTVIPETIKCLRAPGLTVRKKIEIRSKLFKWIKTLAQHYKIDANQLLEMVISKYQINF